MSALSRRGALSLLPAFLAAPAALAAPSEAPAEKIDRLMAELAVALQNYQGGRFLAVVPAVEAGHGPPMLTDARRFVERQKLHHASHAYVRHVRGLPPEQRRRLLAEMIRDDLSADYGCPFRTAFIKLPRSGEALLIRPM